MKAYMLTQSYQAPCVYASGIPHKPQGIRMRRFLKGQIVRGELKHVGGKPTILLVKENEDVYPVPVHMLKEVTAKDISSGSSENSSSASGEKKVSAKAKATVVKMKYIDAIMLGAVLGAGGVYLAEKKGWLQTEDKKVRVYGALIGAGVLAYGLYRYKAYLTEKSKQADKE